jgi:hypothetical protein
MQKSRTLSHASVAYVVGSNVILLALIWWVFQDYAYRASYWRGMGFTPSTSYSPFFYVTTAVRGSTFIQGQLTLDWTQVLGALLVIIDVVFIIGALRVRSRPKAVPA